MLTTSRDSTTKLRSAQTLQDTAHPFDTEYLEDFLRKSPGGEQEKRIPACFLFKSFANSRGKSQSTIDKAVEASQTPRTILNLSNKSTK